jgi:hypothetical protein
MKTTKKPQNKGFTLSSKDMKKLSDQAVIKAIYVDGKWITTVNKLANKTIH